MKIWPARVLIQMKSAAGGGGDNGGAARLQVAPRDDLDSLQFGSIAGAPLVTTRRRRTRGVCCALCFPGLVVSFRRRRRCCSSRPLACARKRASQRDRTQISHLANWAVRCSARRRLVLGPLETGRADGRPANNGRRKGPRRSAATRCFFLSMDRLGILLYSRQAPWRTEGGCQATASDVVCTGKVRAMAGRSWRWQELTRRRLNGRRRRRHCGTTTTRAQRSTPTAVRRARWPPSYGASWSAGQSVAISRRSAERRRESNESFCGDFERPTAPPTTTTVSRPQSAGQPASAVCPFR
jgi:hypothetical protein